jgi:hypothetical protein
LGEQLPRARARLGGGRTLRSDVPERNARVGQLTSVDRDLGPNERLDGPVTPQTFTFMPAATRPSRSQNATNSRAAGSPRKTTSSSPPAKPEYSMPTSYWSE